MKRSLVALGIGAIALSLAACSGSPSSGGSSPAGSASGSSASGETKADYTGKTLTVWIMEGTNPSADDFFDQVKAKFKEETGADVKIEMQPWANAHDKFTTAMAGGTTPDVAEVGTTWTGEFAEAGALVDLTDRINEAGLSKDLVPGLLESAQLDGATYGMPWYAGVRSFIYRTDLFEQAGIKVPTNWAELEQAAKTLKEKDPNVIPWPIAGSSQYGVMPFIWGAGGDLATQSNDKWTSTINTPEAEAGIDYYTGIATKDNLSVAAASTWTEADLLSAFEQGNVGMMISGSWTPARIIADAPDLKGKIGAFAIPGKDSGMSDSFLGGSHMAIFQNSKNQDLAWEFVKMMTTGEFAQEWASQSGYFPGQVSLLEKTIAQDDPLVAPFAKQMAEAGRSVPNTPLYGQIQGKKTVETMVTSILSGQADVKKAADTAAADMNDTFGS